MLPSLPSRVTCETSDFSAGTVALACHEVDLAGGALRVEAIDHRPESLAPIADLRVIAFQICLGRVRPVPR